MGINFKAQMGSGEVIRAELRRGSVEGTEAGSPCVVSSPVKLNDWIKLSSKPAIPESLLYVRWMRTLSHLISITL